MMDMLHRSLILFAQTFNFSPLPRTQADQDLVQTVINIIFVILGAVAVMMVVVGGIQYSASQGDPQGISKAKNTILYAIIGLVLAIFSRAIIGLVFGRIA
jgi:hypothetical protein